MSSTLKEKTEQTRLIEQQLKPIFPSVEAYRYNIASIRVRIIDGRFQGRSKNERHEWVYSVLSDVPERIRRDITILLLLTPAEAKDSLMNLEFDDPSPSYL